MDKIKISGQHKNIHSHFTIRSTSFSVICLCILVFYLVRPILPFVEYAMNKDYISKNLCINKDKPHNCCQGKCYLHEQLKKNFEPLDSNRDTNKKVVPDKIMEDHVPSKGITSNPFEAEIILATNYSFRIIDSFQSSFFVPPKF